MKTAPLITTVIPTYRRPKQLIKAIKSVLNQTYENFQVCVYDNASGDETADVVAELAKQDDRVKYHRHPENIGGVNNFNYGIKEVSTPFFSLLSDDNTILPNFYENAISVLNQHPDAIFFAGQTVMVNEKGQKVGASLKTWPEGLITPPDGLLHIYEKGLPVWESVLFRNNAITSVGLLSTSVNGAADQDFIMKLARKHSIYISKKPCAAFLYHSEAWSTNRTLNEYINSNRIIYEQWLYDDELSDEIKKRITKRWKVFVNNAIANYIYIECVIKGNKAVIESAYTIMNKEVGLSYKAMRSIIIAKLINYNITRRLITTPIQFYLELKKKIISFII